MTYVLLEKMQARTIVQQRYQEVVQTDSMSAPGPTSFMNTTSSAQTNSEYYSHSSFNQNQRGSSIQSENEQQQKTSQRSCQSPSSWVDHVGQIEAIFRQKVERQAKHDERERRKRLQKLQVRGRRQTPRLASDFDSVDQKPLSSRNRAHYRAVTTTPEGINQHVARVRDENTNVQCHSSMPPPKRPRSALTNLSKPSRAAATVPTRSRTVPPKTCLPNGSDHKAMISIFSEDGEDYSPSNCSRTNFKSGVHDLFSASERLGTLLHQSLPSKQVLSRPRFDVSKDMVKQEDRSIDTISDDQAGYVAQQEWTPPYVIHDPDTHIHQSLRQTGAMRELHPAHSSNATGPMGLEEEGTRNLQSPSLINRNSAGRTSSLGRTMTKSSGSDQGDARLGSVNNSRTDAKNGVLKSKRAPMQQLTKPGIPCVNATSNCAYYQEQCPADFWEIDLPRSQGD